MKKIFNLMLILVLTVMVLIPNVSATTTKNDGEIKVTGTIAGKTYKIYELLVLDSYDEAKGAYVYSLPAEEKWVAFFNQNTIKGVYVEIDSKNQVTWIANDAAKVEFAKIAKKYAIDNNIAATATLSGNDGDILFEDLQYGYYLVDSSVGALCGLTTTKPSAEVAEKNSEPTVTKTVKEDSIKDPANEYVTSNTADIGQTVSYKTVINVGKGAENYKLTDTMSEGLTFTDGTLKVQINNVDVASDKYSVVYGTATDSYTFIITFDNEYTKTLAENTEIVVTYDAVLNENAKVGTNENTNTAELAYGDSNAITSITTTKTYSFDLVKTDQDDILLSGATFELYEKMSDGTADRLISFVDLGNGTYRVAHNGGQGTVTSIAAGKVRISGLDKGEYYLVETDNPDGYAKLLDNVDLSITDANNHATMNGDEYVSGGVRVENIKGNLLPSTGGIGTTLFIVIGSLMTVLFGLLLVTKYRMSKMDI